jgi:hypothetical protein
MGGVPTVSDQPLETLTPEAAAAAQAVVHEQELQAVEAMDAAVAATAVDAASTAEHAETVATATAEATEGVADLADAAATTAVEAQQTAEVAAEETLTVGAAIAELREDMNSRFDALHGLMKPKEDHQPEVTEVEVTGNGESVTDTGNKPESGTTGQTTTQPTKPSTGRRQRVRRR